MPDNESISIGQAVQTNWTIQSFAEIDGKPWMALQEHGPTGRVERQFTGYAEDIQELAVRLPVTPQVLPTTTEEQFYSNLPNGTREYELGRHFAADLSRLLPQELEPLAFKRFAEGVQSRELEHAFHVQQTAPMTQRTSVQPRQEQQQSVAPSFDVTV